MTTFADQNILITGGACGIGRLIALKAAQRGATPILWDIHTENLARAVEEVRQQSGRPAYGYVCDISDREAVAATAALVKREVGPVHILVNNAGIVSGRRFLECSDEQLERTIDVNLLGMFWTCRAFLPAMLAVNRGHIVTIASAAGLIGVSGLADYCASKWAAVGFDESLRMELHQLAPQVRTTVVCPFYIDTGLFHGVRTRFPLLLPILKEEPVAERIVRAIAANRSRLVLPWLPFFVPMLRVLPLRLFDWLANFLGINRSMDAFAGRNGQQTDPEAVTAERQE